MHLGIHIENQRIQAGVVDLDGNVRLFSFENSLFHTDYELTTHINVAGYNAYVGNWVQDLRHERPAINYVHHFTQYLGHSSFVYLDANTRKWNAVYLLALFIKKIKQEIESVSMAEVVSCSVSIAPTLTAIQLEELEIAFKYNDISIRDYFKHGYCAALYGLHYEHIAWGDHLICCYLDQYQLIIDVIETSRKELTACLPKRMVCPSFIPIIERIREIVGDIYAQQIGRPIAVHDENIFDYERIIDVIFQSLVLQHKEAYQGHHVFNNEIIKLNVPRDLIAAQVSVFKNDLHQALLAIERALPDLDLSICPYILTGKHANVAILRAAIKSHFEDFNGQFIQSQQNDILAKGLSLFGFNTYRSIQTKEHTPLETQDWYRLEVASLDRSKSIKLMDENSRGSCCRTISNDALGDDIDIDLAGDNIQYVLINVQQDKEVMVGRIMLEPTDGYFVSQFQLTATFHSGKIVAFHAIDLINDQVINVSFDVTGRDRTTQVAPELKPSKEENRPKIKVIERKEAKKINIISAKKPKIKVLNVSTADTIRHTPEPPNRTPPQKKKYKKIKIIESSSDDPKSNNSVSVVEDFKEIIRIIVINNTL